MKLERETSRPSLLHFPPRRISEDRAAQMSFSVAAVLILVLAGASVVILGQASRTQDDIQERAERLDRMMQAAREESEVAEQAAYALALNLGRSSSGLNESTLDAKFREAWSDLVSEEYPKALPPFRAQMGPSDVGLSYLRLTLAESDAAGFSSNGSIEWGDSSIPAYLSLTGNVTVIVEQGAEFVQQAHEFERSIYLPLPFLQDRLESFSRSFEGQKNDYENSVRYMLSALTQARALSGYGAAQDGELGTGQILTDQDADDALKLASALMQLRSFRTCDPSTQEAMAQWLSSSGMDEDILARTGELDPADLFLALEGQRTFDPNLILAQSLYASVDAIVLKWLDYLHIVDLARFLHEKAVDIAVTINSVFDALLGEDEVKESILEWMKEHLADAGIPEHQYRWLNSNRPDVVVVIPSETITLTDSLGEQQELPLGGYYEVDFPRFDIYDAEEWKAFYIDYRRNTYALADVLQEFVRSIALSVAQGGLLPSIELKLDPFDGQSYQDELEAAMEGALSSNPSWFDRALARSQDALAAKDPMGQVLAGFIRDKWMEIFDANRSIEFGIHDLARRMVENATYGMSGFDTLSIDNTVGFLAARIACDGEWGAGVAVRDAFAGAVEPHAELLAGTFEKVRWEGQPELRKLVLDLASGLVAAIPGVQLAMERSMGAMLEDILEYGAIRGDRASIPLRGQEGFEIETPNGAHVRETIKVKSDLPYAIASSCQILRPETLAGQVEGSPNRHLTDPQNLTLAPFQSQFEVCVLGEASLSISSESSIRDYGNVEVPMALSAHVEFGFNLTLCALSGWPLAGVRYSASDTLLKDVEAVFQKIWDGICGALQAVCDAFSKAFSFLQDLLSTVLEYCMKGIQSVSDLLLKLVEILKGLIGGALAGFFRWFAESLADRFGALTFDVTLCGMLFKFRLGIPDISFGRSKEYVHVTVSWATRSEYQIDLRVVDIYKKGPDVVVSASMGGPDWKVQAQLDPMMYVTDHFLEMHGLFRDFVLELSMPEVVQYEKRTFRLSDVPGLGAVLSHIPVPIPGVMASIDAGVEVKYSRPIDDHVVINEVELNPPGPDAGHEWVELYNPRNLPVSINGWTLETAHGDQGAYVIGDLVLQPKGHLKIDLPGQMLDNGGATEIPVGESVTLKDAEGGRVDSSPYITDYYNDANTWHRVVDGSDRWEFGEATPGRPNGLLARDYNDLEQLGLSILDAVLRTMKKMNSSYQGLEWLAELIKRTIQAVVDQLIEILAKALVELSIFVELALQDATQSCSGAMRLALTIDSGFVREALTWIADSIRYALGSLTNPTGVVQKRHDIYQLLDDVRVQFGVFGRIGLPRLFAPMGGGAFMFGAQVSVNLATFIAPPAGPRNWSVEFGALFKEIPGQFLGTAFVVDMNRLVDLWIVKATIRGLTPEEAMSRAP